MTDASPRIAAYDDIALLGLTEAGAVPPIEDDDTLATIGAAILRSIVADLRDDGLGPIADSLGRRMVDAIHREGERLTRDSDSAAARIKRLAADQDGSEIADVELQNATAEQAHRSDLIDALAIIRDSAADAFAAETGDHWTPRSGSQPRSLLTAAVIDARDQDKARRDKRAADLNPEGPRVVVAGDTTLTDHALVWDKLDRLHATKPDMVLCHRNAAGADKIASLWAKARGVPQVVVRTDFNAKGNPGVDTNRRLLDLKPKGVVLFGGGGVHLNLQQEAERRRVKVWTVLEPNPAKRAA